MKTKGRFFFSFFESNAICPICLWTGPLVSLERLYSVVGGAIIQCALSYCAIKPDPGKWIWHLPAPQHHFNYGPSKHMSLISHQCPTSAWCCGQNKQFYNWISKANLQCVILVYESSKALVVIICGSIFQKLSILMVFRYFVNFELAEITVKRLKSTRQTSACR